MMAIGCKSILIKKPEQPLPLHFMQPSRPTVSTNYDPPTFVLPHLRPSLSSAFSLTIIIVSELDFEFSGAEYLFIYLFI